MKFLHPQAAYSLSGLYFRTEAQVPTAACQISHNPSVISIPAFPRTGLDEPYPRLGEHPIGGLVLLVFLLPATWLDFGLLSK